MLAKNYQKLVAQSECARDLKEELGRMLCHVALLCNAFGLDMGEVMGNSVRELMQRYPDKFGKHKTKRKDCTECNGTGRVRPVGYWEYSTCDNCEPDKCQPAEEGKVDYEEVFKQSGQGRFLKNVCCESAEDVLAKERNERDADASGNAEYVRQYLKPEKENRVVFEKRRDEEASQGLGEQVQNDYWDEEEKIREGEVRFVPVLTEKDTEAYERVVLAESVVDLFVLEQDKHAATRYIRKETEKLLDGKDAGSTGES